MRTLTINEAQGQLAQLIAAAHDGENIVLTDGSRRVALEPKNALDLEKDSPELEAELLKAVNGPFTPYSPDETRKRCEQIVREHRQRK